MQLARTHPRVLVLDPVADPPGKGWSTYFGVVSDWRTVIECVKRPQFHLALQMDEEPIESLARVVDIVRSVDARGADAVPNTLVVIEEASLFFEDDRNIRAHPEVRHWVILGRRQFSSWFLISQRYVDIPPPFRSQCTDLHIFGTREDIDLARHHRDIAYVDMLRRMPKYFSCHVDRDGGKLPEIVGPDGRVVRTLREASNDGLRDQVARGARRHQAGAHDSAAPQDRGGLTDASDDQAGGPGPDLPGHREPDPAGS